MYVLLSLLWHSKDPEKYQVLISVLPLVSHAVSATDVGIVVLIYELLGRVGWVA